MQCFKRVFAISLFAFCLIVPIVARAQEERTEKSFSDGAITAHQLDLQPEDRVVCEPNRIRIHRTRAEGGVDPEPLRNISEYAQELTVEGDGSLLVKTRIINQSKSAFFSTPVPPEEYAARFRRLD